MGKVWYGVRVHFLQDWTNWFFCPFFQINTTICQFQVVVSAFIFKTLMETNNKKKKRDNKIVGQNFRWHDLFKETFLLQWSDHVLSMTAKESIMLMPIIKNLADALFRVCLHTNKDMMMYKTADGSDFYLPTQDLIPWMSVQLTFFLFCLFEKNKLMHLSQV